MSCDPVKGCPPGTHNLHCGYPDCEKGRANKTKAPAMSATSWRLRSWHQPIIEDSEGRTVASAPTVALAEQIVRVHNGDGSREQRAQVAAAQARRLWQHYENLAKRGVPLRDVKRIACDFEVLVKSIERITQP